MYVQREQWSRPDDGDDPPCFRQGDLVRITWLRPDVVSADNGMTLRLSSVEARTEVVALMSACCDLVIRKDKRKGFLMSPLRAVPDYIRKKPDLFEAVKANPKEIVEKGIKAPTNLFYFPAEGDALSESVVHLEVLVSIDFAFLKSATKLAELTDQRRSDLQERLKFHFTHEKKTPPLPVDRELPAYLKVVRTPPPPAPEQEPQGVDATVQEPKADDISPLDPAVEGNGPPTPRDEPKQGN